MSQLTKKELNQLKPIMEKLENEAYSQYRSVSGVFANTSIGDYDEEEISICLKFGIQTDCQNEVYTENINVDRATMEVTA